MYCHLNVKNVDHVQVSSISPLVTLCLAIGIITSSSYFPFLRKKKQAYKIATYCIFNDIPLAKLHFIIGL